MENYKQNNLTKAKSLCRITVCNWIRRLIAYILQRFDSLESNLRRSCMCGWHPGRRLAGLRAARERDQEAQNTAHAAKKCLRRYSRLKKCLGRSI